MGDMTAADFRAVIADCAHPRRQLQGAVNRNSGRTFENLIIGACEVYKNAGRAYIEKTPEPMRPIKDLGEGRFIATFEKKAQPDFKGTLSGGHAVCFEAKHTDTEKMAQSRVTPEQTDALNLHSRLGAKCFVMVSFGFRDFFRVPWKVWTSMKEQFGRKYVTAEDLDPCRLDFESGLLKFLD
jgi:recombination protein U